MGSQLWHPEGRGEEGIWGLPLSARCCPQPPFLFPGFWLCPLPRSCSFLFHLIQPLEAELCHPSAQEPSVAPSFLLGWV